MDNISVSTEQKGKEEENTSNQQHSQLETHHSEQEVVDRLFQVPEVSQKVKSIWSWAASFVDKAEKQLDDTVKNLKNSSEDLKHRLDEVTEHFRGTETFKEAKSFFDQNFAMQHSSMPNSSQEDRVLLPWENSTVFPAEIKERILALSTEQSSFLVPPPEQLGFVYDSEKHSKLIPLFKSLLSLDENLKKLKLDLVPRRIDEFSFWKNYFYRVELITSSYTTSTERTTQTLSSSLDENQTDLVLSQEESQKDIVSKAEIHKVVEFDENQPEDYEMFDDDELLAGVDEIESEDDDEMEKRLREKIGA